MLTLAEARLQLNIPDGDTSLDEEIQDYVDAVSAVVERQTGEVVDVRTVEEVHEVHYSSRLVLNSIPVLDIISVKSADGDTWDTSTFTVNNKTGLVVTNGPAFRGFVTVTVQAGYDQIPPNYNLAARIILQHLWKVQRGPSASAFSAANQVPEPGVGFAIPRRAQELLGSMMPGIA